jgi:hypothetical protein
VAPFVQHLGTEGIAALVVLNKVKPRVNNGPIKAYLLEHGADLCAAEVSDRTDFHRTAAQGLAMPDFPGCVFRRNQPPIPGSPALCVVSGAGEAGCPSIRPAVTVGFPCQSASCR